MGVSRIVIPLLFLLGACRRGEQEVASSKPVPARQAAPASSPTPRATPVENPLDAVDPFIGTGGHGHTHPGAMVPHGMVVLGPDTRTQGWDGSSGYHASDTSLTGFSHTHLSGTGIGDYCDILFMPLGMSATPSPRAEHRSAFRGERASPGLYAVHLGEEDVDVELTASARAGFHRYKFAPGSRPRILINLEHRNDETVLSASLARVGDASVEGARQSSGWAKNQRIFFSAEFSVPIVKSWVSGAGEDWQEGIAASGPKSRMVLEFALPPDRTILARVGISAVDIKGAKENLKNEIPEFDFDSTHAAARRAWQDELSVVSLHGGTPRERRIFYTALYHAHVVPHLYMDTDRRYRGLDGGVHLADEFANHTVFSLWDTWRTYHPLMTLLAPARSADWVASLVAHGEQLGRLPVWELGESDTETMIGYHGVSVLADAYLKELPNLPPPERALALMEKSAERDVREQNLYRSLGYVPSDQGTWSVSRTLEFAYDDWTIAALARRLGNDELAERYEGRSTSYRHLFDDRFGFMRPRLQSGSWDPDFSEFDASWESAFIEANSWQYTWSVPHDVIGLARLFGSGSRMIAKLDALWTTATPSGSKAPPDMSGLIGQYAHGNEPSHHVAYLYTPLGRPERTQELVDRILTEMYSDTRDGLSGNEDCGQMSAWYLASALGLYPLTPGKPSYTLVTPRFPRAEIRLANGRRLEILARNHGKGKVYIESVAWNGRKLSSLEISHRELLEGGTLEFTLRDRGQ